MLKAPDACGGRVRSSFFIILLALFTCSVAAAHEGDPLPPDLELPPGEFLRFDETAFRIEAHLSGDDLVLDLLARTLDPNTRNPRSGSYLPFLDIHWALGETETDRSGELRFRLSEHGPAYGTEIPLTAAAREHGTVRIGLTLARRDAHEPFLKLMVPFNLAELEQRASPAAEADGIDAPEDNLRFELLSTIDPRPSASYSDVWGYFDGTTYLAMIGYSDGTLFIDITDPFNPFEVGDIAGPNSSWRDIKTWQHYAYISTEGSGTGQGMQIVDLADPMNPVLVNTWTDTFITCHNLYIDTAIGQLWAIGTDNATRVLDLTVDPENPVDVGAFTPRYIHDLYVKDNWAYFSEINNGIQEIADSTDPAAIQVLSSWTTPDASAHNCWANDTHTLLVTTDETTGGHAAVYDITNKTGPVPLLSEYDPDPSAIVHNAFFDDENNDRVAIAHYGLGLKYIDLHRPEAPVELGSYDTYPSGETGFNGAWGAYPFDPRGYHYVSDIQTGLYILRYAPTGGVLSGIVRDQTSGTSVPGVRVVALSGGETFDTGADGIYSLYVGEGETQLRVSAWGYRTRVVDAGSMPLDGNIELDIDLERLTRTGLSGTVRNAADSTPVEGAVVAVIGSTLQSITGPDGSYQFPEVAVGQQVATAEAFGYSSGEARILLAGGAAGSVDLDLVPGLLVDNAEQALGWTLGVTGDTANTGQWERVDPNGTGGGAVQPENDHTADPSSVAFITGQSLPGASTESNDVEGGFTTLLSPVVDGSGLGAAQLRYYRWVSSNSGFFSGGILRTQISSDGGAGWTNLATQGQANQWNRITFNVGSFVQLTDQLRIRFRAEAVGGLDNFRVLEAGVDDLDLVQACRARFNPAGGDSDSDGLIDPCDGCPLDPADDSDGDGVCGDTDNAPLVANPGQEDGDGDGVGDATDNCPATVNTAQRDLDRDGAGDACDADLDGDGTDDATDSDDDNDGVADDIDICPTVPDPGQPDMDSNGSGDLCDAGDGAVHNLRVNGDRMSWEPEDGSDGYNLYRGDLGAKALLALAACRVAGVPVTWYQDLDQPAPSDGFFYLVSRTSTGMEGTLGNGSEGTPRIVNARCP